ncbi:MAG: hypothetical protein IPN67_03035 [Bacteroidales bacterium]|nr:hypothetical protein [Bacteroidales bacterium]
MTELSGCASVRYIQGSDLPLKEPYPVNKFHYSDYYYYVLGRRSDNPKRYKSYLVKDISVSNGYLIASSENVFNRRWMSVVILVRSDSLIKVASDKSVKIALDDIYQVKVQETDKVIVWGGLILGLIVSGVLMEFFFGSHADNGNKI